MLARAPRENIRMVNYLVDGMKPTPTAAELAGAVRGRIPGAEITFEPDPKIQPLVRGLVRPLDDSRAREEWGWEPTHDLGRMIDDFIAATG
jgi:nucleoside-diphosphate-sugar epimerase